MARDDADHAQCDRWSSISRRFADRVRENPAAVAVEARGRTLTYAQLAARVEDVAARLNAHRPPAGEMLVGLCLERTVDLPAWLLAVFRLGAAYVPIDPTLPTARMARIIDGASPTIVVAGAAFADRLPPLPCDLMVAEDDPQAGACGAVPPCVATGPSTLAYVMYTSGSTGQPKGVEIEHRGIMALLDGIAVRPGLAQGETLLAPTRISFDLSVIDVFLPLIVGARIVLVDLEDAADPLRLAAAIERYRPDFMQATPATWRALLDANWRGLPTLRLLCGGEAMTRDLADRLLPRCAQLWNVYGPTETTVWSTAHRVEHGAGPVPVGRPIDGTKIRIADGMLSPVPDGAAGEIVIGGPGVARGYRSQPELTAERFVSFDDGMRGYRTGDLGRIGDDGVLYCLGRSDDQVKVRGFRIELGDIEAALATHPHIAWAAARAWPDASGENILVAYVVSRLGGALPPGELKAFLATLLPPYMIPTRIVPMAELPLTPNRKVDRGALPNPLPAAAIAAPTAPADADTERRLAAIWCALLHLPGVSGGDDFFDLGGYSLITVRLQRRIEETFGCALQLSDLMRASSLSAMAERIRAGAPITPSGPMLLNAGGHRPPLFWLDAGPLVRRMARHMSKDQPVYALNLPPEDEAALGSSSVDIPAVARAARARLLEAQPEGPFRIGGWCRWGIVAQELACQLRDDGHEVALLVMLDADVPRTRSLRRLSRIMIARLRTRFGRTAPPSPADAVSFSQAVERAVHRHRPRNLKAECLLVTESSPDVVSQASRWRDRIEGRLSLVVSNGDHESMMRDPHVAGVAAAIEVKLADIAAALTAQIVERPPSEAMPRTVQGSPIAEIAGHGDRGVWVVGRGRQAPAESRGSVNIVDLPTIDLRGRPVVIK